MPPIPQPVAILTDNLQRAGRIRPGPQHGLAMATAGLKVIRDAQNRPTPKGQGAMAKALGQSFAPKHMELHDLSAQDDGRTGPNAAYTVAQYNPDKIKETISAVYHEVVVPGLSHERLQYSHTKSVPIEIELYYDALAAVADSKNPNRRVPLGSKYLVDAKKFISSLLYPRAGQQGILQSSPPRVLFYWPNLYSLQCVIREANFDIQKEAPDGTLLQYVCRLKIQEIRDIRLTGTDVRARGTFRSAKPQGR